MNEGGIDRLVRLAHDHLGMGVVYIAEFTGGRQICRAIAGPAADFGMQVGHGPTLGDTYCQLMVDGQLPNVIPDTSQNSRVRELPVTSRAGIGAYVGVPLYLPDGQVYGSFCGLSHGVEEDLNARDAKFLALLGEFVADELARERRLSERYQALTRVIDSRDLKIALQPIIDLVSGQCISMEALTRFQEPLGAPDGVFAQADKVGLRLRLEQLAVQEAVARLDELSPQQCLAVNVSPDVALQLLELLPDDQALSRVIIEITEHAAVHDYKQIRDSVRPLQERGMQLAIDDAGAGFASLRHIIELEPDVIKIDRALVAGIDQDPGRRSALTTFVMLALDIDARVIAEGVETYEELATVAALGVDYAQGYLLARPSTNAQDVARWASGVSLLPEALAQPA